MLRRQADTFLPSFADYMTEREISLLEARWCDASMPIQVYSGKALKDERRRQTFKIDSTTNLSRSSESLLTKSLTEQERERLESKIQAEARASRTLTPEEHLHILYADAHICVVHKPSGVLCVPGPRRNPSAANLVYDVLQPPTIHIDQMVVHRLDMDTSGIVIFAQAKEALQQLHRDFRDRDRIQKTYNALVCGHVQAPEGEIDLALERDPNRPPFMRVSLEGRGEDDDESRVFGAFAKEINKAPKASLTAFRVLAREYLGELPVTRVELKPYTGRTHQLRVHCAAIGHPIVGDDIYGLGGEGSPNGGLLAEQMEQFPDRASLDLQQSVVATNMNLCLHARRLCIYHPCTQAPMVFQVEPNF